MDTCPKVSVLVNSYNYGIYLARAVESVLAQDYRGEVECIVVDDGSTDDTPEVVKPFLDRVTYIRQENGGQPSAVNTGYRASSGEVIFFLDADDFWASEKITVVMERYARQPELGLVNHSHILVDEDGGYVNRSRESVDAPVVSSEAGVNGDGDLRESVAARALPWLFNTTSTMSLPRSLCEVIFPLDEELRANADTLFATAASLLAPVGFIEEPLGFYRLHGSNFWAEKDDVSRRERVRVAYKRFTFSRLVMEKAGLPWQDFMYSWECVKCRGKLQGRPFVVFLPEVLGRLWRWKEATAAKKLSRSWEITYKAIDRTLRGKWR